MASGLTYMIRDGATFPQFLWKCAQQFGAVAFSADEGGRPSASRTPDRYLFQAVSDAKARLEVLRNMPPEKAAERARQAHLDCLAANARVLDESAGLRAQYEAMLAQTEQWNPPTDAHAKLKKLMIEQLHDSIRFDCRTGTRTVDPAPLSGEDWLAQELEWEQMTLASAESRLADAQKHCEDCNKWVQALMQSVPVPDPLEPSEG